MPCPGKPKKPADIADSANRVPKSAIRRNSAAAKPRDAWWQWEAAVMESQTFSVCSRPSTATDAEISIPILHPQIQGRKNQKSQKRGSYQASNNYCGQRSLDFGAGACV